MMNTLYVSIIKVSFDFFFLKISLLEYNCFTMVG